MPPTAKNPKPIYLTLNTSEIQEATPENKSIVKTVPISKPSLDQISEDQRSKTPQPVLIQPSASIQRQRLPSIDSDAFTQFIESETKKLFENGSADVSDFKQSFKPTPKPDFSEKESKPSQPLSGGIYKRRRGSIECQALTMVPQTFDETTGALPILSTQGECRDLNQKIQLTDEDGKLRNTDHQDWP